MYDHSDRKPAEDVGGVKQILCNRLSVTGRCQRLEPLTVGDPAVVNKVVVEKSCAARVVYVRQVGACWVVSRGYMLSHVGELREIHGELLWR